jgi:spore maturation protein CgeB
MIAYRSPCFEEFNFVDGHNCLMFEDLDDIGRTIGGYTLDRNTLSEIQANGAEFVTTNYTHDKIADLLMTKIDYLWREQNRKPILS